MRVIGIDLETTGLDPLKDEIIEIGAVLWDVELAIPLMITNNIVNGPIISDEIQKITGITPNMQEEFGVDISRAMNEMLGLYNRAEFCVGHNGLCFDKLFLDRTVTQLGVPELKLQWFDTMLDIPHLGSRSLVHACADQGFINPFKHRALFDALSSLTIFSQYYQVSLTNVVDVVRSPMVEIVALVTFDNKKLASSRGYQWKPERKVWSKMVRKCNVERERKEAPFKIETT